MSYIDASRNTAPFGAITLYRAGSLLADASAAVAVLVQPARGRLRALSPAELEDIGLSIADLSPARRGVFAQLVDIFRAWNARRRTVDALGRLSEAQLDDIGLTRWDVEELRAGRVTF
jgi:uncharacterized protein YjiS (DUF1127 family)